MSDEINDWLMGLTGLSAFGIKVVLPIVWLIISFVLKVCFSKKDLRAQIEAINDAHSSELRNLKKDMTAESFVAALDHAKSAIDLSYDKFKQLKAKHAAKNGRISDSKINEIGGYFYPIVKSEINKIKKNARDAKSAKIIENIPSLKLSEDGFTGKKGLDTLEKKIDEMAEEANACLNKYSKN